MAFKILLVVAAMIALARAGGPAAYSILAPSGDHHSVGSVHEHTVKGPYGQSAITEYTKTDDSPHSHVRVSSSSHINDVHGSAHIGGPILSHGLGLAGPAVVSHGAVLGHGGLALGHGGLALGHGGLSLGHGGLGLGHGGLALGHGGLALGHGGLAHGGLGLGHGGLALGHSGLALGHGIALGHGLAGPSVTHHGILSAPAVHNGISAGYGHGLGLGLGGHGLINGGHGVIGHGVIGHGGW